MKTILLLSGLLLLCGCSPTVQRQPFNDVLTAHYGASQFALLNKALAIAKNKDDVLPVLASLVEVQVITDLSTAAPSELERLLARVDSGKDTGYTRHEIIAAMKLRNERPGIRRKLVIPPE